MERVDAGLRDITESRWGKASGVLYDVMRLLESVGRLYRGSGYGTAILDDVWRLSCLVASHTLKPVLDECNSEKFKEYMVLLNQREQENSNSVKY
jgi:hypothetical protein